MHTHLKLSHHHHHHPILSSTHISLTSISKPFNLLLPYTHNVHSPPLSLLSHKPTTPSPFKALHFSLSYHQNALKNEVIFDDDGGGGEGGLMELEDLDPDSQIYQNTLRLVECSMFASVSGLAYLLSNSLSIENYFGCFFALPIVISSMRWGAAAGRKTMVATAVLLLVLSGPVKALTYVLMHGLLGFTMGSLWRLRVSWTSSIFLCTLVRAIGALGYVVVSSFLIRENILALITINVHATLTLIFNSLGFYTVPSMNTIYTIFGTLLLLNCCFFVFLLHILYSLFLTRLGMKAYLVLPRWLQNAL